MGNCCIIHMQHVKNIDPWRLRHKMVNDLQMRGISNIDVLEAMKEVPRHLFVQEALQVQAYEDTALPIGNGQTISQPYTVAFMTQVLEPKKGLRILEIGTGSGYQAAILAKIGCTVFSIEINKELYFSTKSLLKSLGFFNIHLLNADGTLGIPNATFDRIIVTAGGPKIPEPLISQLDEGGILIIPVGEKKNQQNLLRVKKNNNKCTTEMLGSAIFVDLVGNHGWSEEGHRIN